MKEDESSAMKACIENCRKCHKICSDTILHCLSLGGKHAEISHIRLLLDCMEICQTSYNFMARCSDFSSDLCRSCGEICKKCADSCAKFDDKQMKECAKICKECHDSCREMSRLDYGEIERAHGPEMDVTFSKRSKA